MVRASDTPSPSTLKLWPLLLLVTIGGCERSPQERSVPSASVSPTAATPPTPVAPAPNAVAEQNRSAAPPDTTPPSQRTAPQDDSQRWIVDAPVAVGPAAPATASPAGVVLVANDDTLAFARLNRLHAGKPSIAMPVEPSSKSVGSFSFVRGPAVASDFVYWISHGRLVRRIAGSTDGGTLEVLARDARLGTRVSVPTGFARSSAPLPASAAYIAEDATHTTLLAKLWVAHQDSLLLTPDGAAANSVALIRTESGLLALALESRTGMTQAHAREIRFDAQGTPRLLEDRVVWVGGTGQATTELTALAASHGIWGLVPIERDATRFGLARWEIGTQSPATWLEYPNGLDPAPVAATQLCGEPVAVIARPEAATARSAQVLELLALGEAAEAPFAVAHARGFLDISLATTPEGALLVYVADGHTWASTIQCRK